MVNGQRETEHDQDTVLLAIPTDASADSHKIHVVPESRSKDFVGDYPLFYTQIDRESSKIAGFLVERASMSSTKTWNINFGKDTRIISVKTQYDTVSTAHLQEHFLPTEFGEDGVLLYKFLDKNVFSVIL